MLKNTYSLFFILDENILDSTSSAKKEYKNVLSKSLFSPVLSTTSCLDNLNKFKIIEDSFVNQIGQKIYNKNDSSINTFNHKIFCKNQNELNSNLKLENQRTTNVAKMSSNNENNENLK